ncbi:MAG: NADH-quinone oxidoreductase subunit [Bacteroidota bacterium]|jgi:NADH-quinone oxidoreductase subunit C|nr:NADH-quinone oxidoreductase subunit [Bacteroidota bacterium]
MENTLLTTVGDKLKSKFGDAIVSAEQHYDFPVYVIRRDAIYDVLKFLKEDEELAFGFLTTMCGLHYPDNKGQELGVMYQLHNLPKNLRIRLKTFFPVSDPTLPTITTLYPTANWMERQEYDFFGIIFKGHPNLKRILNMDEMTYHPMRKEYPLEDGTREDKDDKMFGR